MNKVLPAPARSVSLVMGVLVINPTIWSILLGDPLKMMLVDAKMTTCLNDGDPLKCLNESDDTIITP